MQEALGSYLPTLIRYLCVAAGMLLLIYGSYRLQVSLGMGREAATGRALIMPWLVGFLIFNVFTIGASLYLSFTEYNLFSAPRWVGWRNYQELFQLSAGVLEHAEQSIREVLPRRFNEILRLPFGDSALIVGAREEAFWRAVRLTLPYAFLSVPLGLIGSLAVAMLLNQKVRALSFWRVLYYMPAVLPAVASALLWRWMFAQSGLINIFLRPLYRLFGWSAPQWFTDPNLALPAFIIVSLWGVFGANSVILLAGLKGIPLELYEAADLDGAGAWAKFWNVTIPMLSPALFYNLVVSTIGALQVFEVAAFIHTPARVGTFLNWLIFREAFEFRRMGMASAMSWIMLLMIVALTALIFRSSQAWVFYQGSREEA
jgi:multiple sugar transport system permease protein